MEKLKVKVMSTTIGRFDVDSMQIKIDDELIDICFEKSVNIAQYNGKEIVLLRKNNKYEVEPSVDVKPQIAKK